MAPPGPPTPATAEWNFNDFVGVNFVVCPKTTKNTKIKCHKNNLLYGIKIYNMLYGVKLCVFIMNSKQQN